jgi:hypothetical protein
MREQYGFKAFPINYLIGADGQIIYRAVGFKEAEIKAVIEKRLPSSGAPESRRP